MPAESGRIWFIDNPWPSGHAIREFHWSGRLTKDGSLWFDLHLETVDYDSEHQPACDQDDDWHSPEVWNNFQSCILSSTYWADEGSRGLFAGHQTAPFRWASLEGLTLNADSDGDAENTNTETPPSFRIYLTGHDAVANHQVRFQRGSSNRSFCIEWAGLIALAYIGDHEFKYAFRAIVPSVVFEGFKVPTDMSPNEARRIFSGACHDGSRFSIQESGDGLVLIEDCD